VFFFIFFGGDRLQAAKEKKKEKKIKASRLQGLKSVFMQLPTSEISPWNFHFSLQG
jgi:hypothetical protein